MITSTTIEKRIKDLENEEHAFEELLEKEVIQREEFIFI